MYGENCAALFKTYLLSANRTTTDCALSCTQQWQCLLHLKAYRTFAWSLCKNMGACRFTIILWVDEYDTGNPTSVSVFSSKLLHLEQCPPFSITLYMVRQFNSRNGPVKVKFAYLCTNGWWPFEIISLWSHFWDEGATAGNSLANRFPDISQ
jgi:hypothetical protein